MNNFFLILAMGLATLAYDNSCFAQEDPLVPSETKQTKLQESDSKDSKESKSGEKQTESSETKPATGTSIKTESKTQPAKKETEMETATFGAGCFWCVEAVFQKLEGVESVMPGYMGGRVENPTYKHVLTGRTGHAEVIQIKFKPDVISFSELLYVFWQTHDPTTLNQQGADVGTQYRSAIFYHSDAQKEAATELKQKLNKERYFGVPVVTEITAASTMYEAEDYHKNYFNRNAGNPYCQNVIPPKLLKLKKLFGDKLKAQFK